MKSPAELAARLARQWQVAELRAGRLLQAGHWPLCLAIGKPSAKVFGDDPARVRQHIQLWREVGIGQVIWVRQAYRAGSEPVDIPLAWHLHTPSEWLAATGDSVIQAEFRLLGQCVAAVDARFRALIVRQRRWLADRAVAEVTKASQLAMALSPGCAAGHPLRALTLCNIDSKFIERNRALLVQMLDVRFDGQVSQMGLEPFLDAADEADHWLLLVPLADGLLPFARLRVRSRDLATLPDAVSHVVVIENEHCVHQLPPLAGTVAILGAGLNLGWMQGAWLARRCVAYWGDMDSWGLAMLAKARMACPHLHAVLMDSASFAAYADKWAVPEPVGAGAAPAGLEPSELAFYRYLAGCEKGRLEQEFLPVARVGQALRDWRDRSN